MKKIKRMLGEQDIQCLYLLWKWKMLTTAALAHFVFGGRSLNRSYRRLLVLESERLIQAVASKSGAAFLWMLNDKGYELIKGSLPILKMSGYKSENIEHDFWVTAIHLTPWYHGIPTNCSMMSEQELRRIDFENYPDWAPKTLSHRPDGWWKITEGGTSKIIALEVELSMKTQIAYTELAEFYHSKDLVRGVLWFVKNQAAIDYIQRHLIRGSINANEKHSFFLVDHYFQTQGHTPVVCGKDCGKSFSEIFSTSSVLCESQGTTLGLLDTRKKPTKPVTSNKLKMYESPLSKGYLW